MKKSKVHATHTIRISKKLFYRSIVKNRRNDQSLEVFSELAMLTSQSGCHELTLNLCENVILENNNITFSI